MTISERITSIRQGFAPTFWIANTLELFERLAFYGAKAVLAYFLAKRVGLEEEAGTLTGLFSGLVYSLPIIAGVFVDKYGYRRTLMTCFAIFSIGYFSIGMAGMHWSEEIVAVFGKRTYVLIALMLTAIGGSLIKPCIVGVVANTSKEGSKTLGFSIYYSLVNFGGAIGPLTAMVVREDLGIEFVLVMSSLTCLALFFGTMFFFTEPESSDEKRTFAKVFADMLVVFSNVRFMIFLIVFSGFWIMFWQIFYLIPFYSTEVLHFEKFEILETVDAIGIIFFSLFMGSMFSKWKPFTAMTFGLVVASFSWIIIAFFGTTWAVIVAVALYSLGEGTLAPRFYEYVSTLAPKEQMGTYMGFAFLPVAIGSFGAGPVADWLRLSYLQTNPTMMWYILAGIGVATSILIVIYNLFLTRK